MNNFFISKVPFDLTRRNPIIHLLNTGLRFIKCGYQIYPLPAPGVEMNTIEQRINYFHLLDSVIASDIAGDVIELGCFTGQCAMLFQKVIELHHSQKELHLYDNFESKYTLKGNVETVLKNNFRKACLNLPVLHKGYFENTIPVELPVRISFAHIDCGSGDDALVHRRMMNHCLQSIYPRMSKGAVCVLMDYHDNSITDVGFDANPGVKLSCDEFLSTKPEEITAMYGNHYSHGFFRKV